VPWIPPWVFAVIRVDEPYADDRFAVDQTLLASNRVPRGDDLFGNVLEAGDATATRSLTVQIGHDGFGALLNLRVGPAGRATHDLANCEEGRTYRKRNLQTFPAARTRSGGNAGVIPTGFVRTRACVQGVYLARLASGQARGALVLAE
jgi:hypothetical protein